MDLLDPLYPNIGGFLILQVSPRLRRVPRLRRGIIILYIYRVVKVGGSKEDKINGAIWALKNGIINKEKYDKRIKEIEEEFKNK